MILGLDISTSIIGYSIISPNKELLKYGHIKMPSMQEGKKTIDYVLNTSRKHFVNEIEKVIEDYEIEKAYIEKPYTFFKGGGSNSHTMSLLIFLNGIIGDYILNNVCDSVEYVESKSVKKHLGLKYSTKGLSQYKSRKLKKEKTIEKINEIYSEFEIRKGKRGGFEKGLDDEADAISLALMYFLG